MKAGPKQAVDDSALPFRSSLTGSARFAAWCKRHIRVPKGTNARKPLILREWQRELVGSVLDADPRPRIAGWCLPRGQGKSTLLAAYGLYALMDGGEGATVIVCAVDERQAGIIFRIAQRMVELNDALAARVQVFKDRMEVPARGASFHCLPAEPKRLEGQDFSVALVDEVGVVNPETWEVVCLASGKRETSTVVGIGTPSASETSVLADLRQYAHEHPEDGTQVYREFSAAGFEDHPVDCQHCWDVANPALDDFLYRDAMHALLPPKMTEGNYRRSRLCQFVSTNENPFVGQDTWDALATGQGIADGSEVVLAFDGSHSGDTTALLVGTVSQTPHFDRVNVWANPGDPNWRVPVLEVEQAIRDACKRWAVKEVVADPFRWTRSLQVLQAEGIPIVEFPHNPSRLTAATNDLHRAIVNGQVSHSGDDTLTKHVMAATVVETDKGLRLGKVSRSRTAPKIDLAACLLMAHSRATWLATRPKKRNRTVSFA